MMEWKAVMLTALVMVALTVTPVLADTPANCTYDDIQGTWNLYETERSGDATIDCDNMGPIVHKTTVKLSYPNVAVDQFGNHGTWTMVYNQGFEVRVAGRSYFAFSFYEKSGSEVVSLCGKTLTGWSRDVTVRNWACYRGQKHQDVDVPKTYRLPSLPPVGIKYRVNSHFVDAVNSAQNSWVADLYPEYERLTLRQHLARAGGRMSSLTLGGARAAKSSFMSRVRSASLPASWDWRSVSGINYVSPVRNQGSCGSCYAFASLAGLESRIRIMTNNTKQPVFAPQDVVGCSRLSQGCDGGFPFLVAGRYGQDVGLVVEECSPYEGHDDSCRTRTSCTRHYTAAYRYVGGYYGACNEEKMKVALVEGGPLIVGLEVYNDFLHYKGGVYHHTGLTDSYNPFEETNHAVLVVGYGTDTGTGEDYWLVKNSWGQDWGEGGFFRIRRGMDECSIESMAVEAVPIP